MLDGLLVLELASVLAGPSVGQFLAELGARVVKVENPRTGGDVTRSWLRREEIGGETSSYFASCNFGKESVCLDLTLPSGRRALHRMAGRADVVIASFAPGQAERLGADGATLCALNGRLIHASVTGYGPASPRTGYDAVLQAESGFMAMNGHPDGPPTKMPVALVDLLAAHQLKQAVLLALYDRERTGKGQAVTVSLFDAAIASLANQGTAWLNAGAEPRRMGSLHPNIAPYGTLCVTADGVTVLLAVGTDRQFARLCAAVGLDGLAADPRFAENAGRVAHREVLDGLLRPAVAPRVADPLLDRLHADAVPAGRVRPVSEALSLPAAEAVLLPSPAAVGLRQAVFASGGRALAPPPVLGADSRSVLASLGGLAPDEIALHEPRPTDAP